MQKQYRLVVVSLKAAFGKSKRLSKTLYSINNKLLSVIIVFCTLGNIYRFFMDYPPGMGDAAKCSTRAVT